LQVALPFAPSKYWAFPILVRMYRKRLTNQRAPGKGGELERKQTGQATAMQYRTRPELALEMIQIVAGWIPQRMLRILGDSEYAGQSISRHANAKLIRRMNMKAALYAPAGKVAQRGRRRKKGERLPSPLQIAHYKKAKWIKTTLTLYGKQVKLWYQTIDALWYPSAGQHPCASSWYVIPVAAAAMIASPHWISPSPPRKSWNSFPAVGPWKFASATSSSFWALKIPRIAWPRPPHAPLL
jgi:hypothetical protein